MNRLVVGLFPSAATAASSYAHWGARNIVISDRTGDPGWQVASKRAVQVWAEAGAAIQVSWREGGIGCSFSGTVVPFCRDAIQQGWTGATAWRASGDGHLDGNVVLVDASRTFSQPLKDAIACHELGHVLGLNHTSNAASCLDSRSTSTRPSAQD
ncbi:MAG: matrixin family metalloprotease, partial [Solirubrobacterales bacterium]